MKIPIISLSLLTFILLSIVSCKKDRISPPKEPIKEYSPLNDYFNTKKQQEQSFEITEASNDTITGIQGSRILGTKNCLKDSNGDTIAYPFTIYLLALYTPKDMIYWQIPSIANGNILETDGEIRIRAAKDGQDLTLSCPFEFQMPNTSPNSNRTIFRGADNGTFVDWFNTGIPFAIENYSNGGFEYGYKGTIISFGWINAAIQIGSGSGNKLTFTSQTDNLNNVGIFIYISASKTVMQVYNQTSGIIPMGSDIKIIVMGIDDNGKLFSYTANRKINNSDTIDVSLSETTDGRLTAHLDGL